MKTRVKKCDVCLWILALLIFLWGVFGLTVLPSIYDNIVHKNTILSHKNDESLGISATMFSKPPMINTMKFLFWNITNVDEIVYEGARPRVIETGPYTFIESEEKRYLKFRNDDTEVFYQNYKKWIYHDELSCADCDYTDTVTIPNAIQVGATNMLSNDPHYDISDQTKLIVALFLLATGENPFNMPRVGDLLFDGYNDPLLTAAHSNLVNFISDVFNNGVSIVPFPFPDMLTMAYFNGYNNSRDEEYWVKTGKENIDDLGVIVSWKDTLMLPESWWTTEQARMINGTDTGSFAKPNLNENDILPMFHSYLCRSFNAVYDKKTEIAGIPSLLYTVPYDEWDTTLPRNKGFRYMNYENKEYFPGWIQCPKWNSSACVASPDDPIDCNDKENLCHNCCNKGKIGDSYVLPPGFFPLACYPGRMEPSPFAVLWSPPHMLYSPDEVVKSVNGMAPDMDQHQPLQYDHEPYSGMITHVTYRVQVNMPVYANPDVPTNAHLPTAIIPMFYESSEAFLQDFAYTYFQIGFVFMPVFLMWLSIAEIIIGVLIALLVIFMRSRRNSYKKI